MFKKKQLWMAAGFLLLMAIAIYVACQNPARAAESTALAIYTTDSLGEAVHCCHCPEGSNIAALDLGMLAAPVVSTRVGCDFATVLDALRSVDREFDLNVDIPSSDVVYTLTGIPRELHRSALLQEQATTLKRQQAVADRVRAVLAECSR